MESQTLTVLSTPNHLQWFSRSDPQTLDHSAPSPSRPPNTLGHFPDTPKSDSPLLPPVYAFAARVVPAPPLPAQVTAPLGLQCLPDRRAVVHLQGRSLL